MTEANASELRTPSRPQWCYRPSPLLRQGAHQRRGRSPPWSGVAELANLSPIPDGRRQAAPWRQNTRWPALRRYLVERRGLGEGGGRVRGGRRPRAGDRAAAASDRGAHPDARAVGCRRRGIRMIAAFHALRRTGRCLRSQADGGVECRRRLSQTLIPSLGCSRGTGGGRALWRALAVIAPVPLDRGLVASSSPPFGARLHRAPLYAGPGRDT